MNERINVKENVNMAMNIVLIIMTGVGGYLAKQVYESTNETRERVAVIQANQINDKHDVAAVQTTLAALQLRMQANEIEVIKLQQRVH